MGVRLGHDGVALAERELHVVAQLGVVVDKEKGRAVRVVALAGSVCRNALAVSTVGAACLVGFALGVGHGESLWHGYEECRAFAFLALERYRTFLHDDKFPDKGESQPGAGNP